MNTETTSTVDLLRTVTVRWAYLGSVSDLINAHFVRVVDGQTSRVAECDTHRLDNTGQSPLSWLLMTPPAMCWARGNLLYYTARLRLERDHNDDSPRTGRGARSLLPLYHRRRRSSQPASQSANAYTYIIWQATISQSLYYYTI